MIYIYWEHQISIQTIINQNELRRNAIFQCPKSSNLSDTEIHSFENVLVETEPR